MRSPGAWSLRRSAAARCMTDEIEHTARRLDGLAVRTGDRLRIALFGGNSSRFQCGPHRTRRAGDDPSRYFARGRKPHDEFQAR